MNLEDDNIFNKEINKLDLDLEDYEHFKEFFGSQCENEMPEEMDLKKTFILQSIIKRKAAELDMDDDDVMEALTELCIGTYS
jgi:hypothetical protein